MENNSSGTEQECEILRTRLFMYEVARSFFSGEPSDEMCSRWGLIFAAIEESDASVSKEAGNLKKILEKYGCEGVKEEYYRLFVDPYSEERVNVTVSFYADGRSMGESLAGVRALMHEAGLVKEEVTPEPEDSMPVLLDSMINLLEDQDDRSLQAAHLLFKHYLLPVTEAVARRLQALDEFHFYGCVGSYLREWIYMEQPFFQKEEVTL